MKDLAPRNRQKNLLLPIIVGLLSAIWTYNSFIDSTSEKVVFTIAIIFGLHFIWVLFAYNTFNFYYDNEFLILKNSRKLIKVHFNKISKVKLTLSDLKILGMSYSEYRIEFYDEENKLNSKSFWTSSGRNVKFEDFEKSIKKVNPKIEIQNFASTIEQ